jgi:hypothetical protein
MTDNGNAEMRVLETSESLRKGPRGYGHATVRVSASDTVVAPRGKRHLTPSPKPHGRRANHERQRKSKFVDDIPCRSWTYEWAPCRSLRMVAPDAQVL